MKRITLIVFIGFLYFVSIGTFVTKDISYSENENRYLQAFPKFSIDNLVSGKFTSQFESYVQDHIIFRNDFVNLKAHSALSLKMLENNDVYITDKGLINQFILNDDTILNDNISNINNYPGNVDVMIVPTAAEINNGFLNPLSYNTSQKQLLAEIKDKINKNFIDIYATLDNGEDNYFNTDHHWNVFGANSVYRYYMGIKAKPVYDYTFSQVSNDFQGTIYSKSGLFDYPGEVFNTINEVKDLNLDINIDGKMYNSVYFDDYLQKKDKYSYFLDGNHSLVTIHNNDLTDGSSILLVKDSYAHIFSPMLLKDYEDVYLIDLRFYQQPVSEYVEENKIQTILILYNLESFCSDTNLNLLR